VRLVVSLARVAVTDAGGRVAFDPVHFNLASNRRLGQYLVSYMVMSCIESPGATFSAQLHLPLSPLTSLSRLHTSTASLRLWFLEQHGILVHLILRRAPRTDRAPKLSSTTRLTDVTRTDTGTNVRAVSLPTAELALASREVLRRSGDAGLVIFHCRGRIS
jgi:hypothetical protein